MTTEEIIAIIDNKHAIQFIGYSPVVQDMIRKYFSAAYYETRKSNTEFFSAFCGWFSIPKEDYPHLLQMVDIYGAIRVEAEALQTLTDSDNENMAKITKLLNSMPHNKRIIFVQSFLKSLHETV